MNNLETESFYIGYAIEESGTEREIRLIFVESHERRTMRTTVSRASYTSNNNI